MPPAPITRTLSAALAAKPRVNLGHFPTPLDVAPRLSARLGVRVLVKRDDETGLALGGNKVRKLEYLLADAMGAGADTIVTTGGSQSNHARLTAAACRRLGLDCHLVLDRGRHPEGGNLLLDHLFHAEVHLLESADPTVATDEMERVATALRERGRKPYVVPRGGSVPAGATGYAAMVVELLDQLDIQDSGAIFLYLGTGSTGTHSGALAGITATRAPIVVEGISVSRPRDDQVLKVQTLSRATLHWLGLDIEVSADAIHVDDRFRGPGYGIPTDGTMEAIEIAAVDEALILDPVYTGKAMAGLIAHADEQRFSANDTVIFLHTGGAPALFAYHAETETALASSTA